MFVLFFYFRWFYIKKKRLDILFMMCDLYFEKNMFCLFKVKSNVIFIVMI